jgi:chromosome segregation protein
MYLRSIKLRGFKSFQEPVEVRLEPGVAVIVGPNGSGKSNVADGIVWAAGSLAPSALRAGKPDDVLFAGAAGRPAADHCEVELVFDNTGGDGPLPYSELSVARRLSRGGDGHYLINRAVVRRTDVVELLGDAGLGHEMHAVIGQGRVEQVLSSKPAERRALIEEAAGLGSFKQRRHRAELKLARVQVQVDKARSLEDEARKRLRPLALQATAATRAAKLADEIERIRVALGADRLARLDERLTALGERRAAAGQEQRRRETALEGVLAERRRAEDELEQAARRHEEATAGLYRLRSAVERLSVRRENVDEVARTLRRDAGRARQLADAPRDDSPHAELEIAENALREAGARSRAALHERESADAARRLAFERLEGLDQSLAEREGLPPAARALADRGEQLALAALDVDPGYERAVAAALGGRASAVLAAGAARGFELVEEARRGGLGPLMTLVAGAEQHGSGSPPIPGGESLRARVRPVSGGERVAALLDDVWVVDAAELAQVECGIAVTRNGHGYDPARGELWYAGKAAESVLLELQARRRALAAEAAELDARLAQATSAAEELFVAERAARERVTRGRASVALMPPRVDPAEADLLERLAEAGERFATILADALEAAGRFEPPLQARVDAGRASSTALGEELRRLGGSESELRRAATEASTALSALEVDAARVEAERNDLRSRLPDETKPVALEDAECESLATTKARLEQRREALGQINPLAAEELEREKERLGELAAQREDLERSLEELEQLRADLVEEVERRFEETYGAVEQHFAEVAASLFPGGEGRLRLTMPDDDDAEPGVEVELRPAGKKITSLSLLSGGEKALGALSFLFALFLARPCPFYLLDEVEAALDDTNIGRFVQLLRRYADRAQFIVITHQKRTMEAADILYGVTMANDGVSQIVSKRLAQRAVEAASA